MRSRFAVLAPILLLAADASVLAAPVGKETPPSSDRLKALQKERVKTLKEALQGQLERVKIGKDPLITFIDLVRELGDAELDVAETREQRLAAYDRMVSELQSAEDELAKLFAAGLQTKQGLARIKAARLKAEIQREKFKLAR